MEDIVAIFGTLWNDLFLIFLFLVQDGIVPSTQILDIGTSDNLLRHEMIILQQNYQSNCHIQQNIDQIVTFKMDQFEIIHPVYSTTSLFFKTFQIWIL